MPIPALDQHGLLPIGVHDCDWQEVAAAFCWNQHRINLFHGLQTFLQDQWAPLALQADFWVDGSFTRRKHQPEDIDLVADLTGMSDQVAFPAIILSMHRPALKVAYHVDFWIKHPLIPTDLTEYFKYAGLKAGAELGLDSKHVKGILRITP